MVLIFDVGVMFVGIAVLLFFLALFMEVFPGVSLDDNFLFPISLILGVAGGVIIAFGVYGLVILALMIAIWIMRDK